MRFRANPEQMDTFATTNLRIKKEQIPSKWTHLRRRICGQTLKLVVKADGVLDDVAGPAADVLVRPPDVDADEADAEHQRSPGKQQEQNPGGIAGSLGDARHQTLGNAETARHVDDFQARVFGPRRGQDGERFVIGIVVDENQFVIEAFAGENGVQALKRV